MKAAPKPQTNSALLAIAFVVLALHMQVSYWLKHQSAEVRIVEPKPIEVTLTEIVKEEPKPELPKPTPAPAPKKPTPPPVKAKPKAVAPPKVKAAPTIAPIVKPVKPKAEPKPTTVPKVSEASEATLPEPPAPVKAAPAPPAAPKIAPSSSQNNASTKATTASSKASNDASGNGKGENSGIAVLNCKHPKYPPRALSRQIEGHVLVEYTVTASGSVSNPEIISADPPDIFDSNTLDAISKCTFKPRVVNGKTVEQRTKQTITFSLPH